MLPPGTCYVVDAPAKINLWLRVTGRREDGFHELETRLAPLELADRLTLWSGTGGEAGRIDFSCDDPAVPGDDSNLVVKAVRALEKLMGPFPALRFFLEKRIPHGAGLGGGSSDAAAALRLVKSALDLRVEDEELERAAAAVGSDVPFFLSGGVADAAGRGEKITAVPDFDGAPPVLLVKLPFGIPTPWAYREWKEASEVPGLPYQPQITPWGELRNDLERPVFEKYQVLGHLKAALARCPGVTAALMSGSGSTVFALLDGSAELEGIRSVVQEEVGSDVWICETRIAPGLRPMEVLHSAKPPDATNVAL